MWRGLYDLTNLTGRHSGDFCPYSASLWAPSLATGKRQSSMKRFPFDFHTADWVETALPSYRIAVSIHRNAFRSFLFSYARIPLEGNRLHKCIVLTNLTVNASVFELKRFSY